jgi:hypothetical protein
MVVPLIVPAPGHLKAIMINNNASRTNNPTVDLILSALGATEMKISNDVSLAGAVWEPYTTAKQWELRDDLPGPAYGDGEKIVYVKFQSVSQISDVFSASIILDTTPPLVGAVPIIINGGALKTDTRQVTLILNATGADLVEIFNEIDIENITGGTIYPYQNTLNWTLSEGNGIKTVYVTFMDVIGNKSSFFSASITLIGQTVSVPVIIPVSSPTTKPFVSIQGTGDPGASVQINITKEST